MAEIKPERATVEAQGKRYRDAAARLAKIAAEAV